MAKDPTSTSGPSRKPEHRKPVTLDLSAEPVVKAGSGETGAAPPPADKPAQTATPEAPGATGAAPEAAKSAKAKPAEPAKPDAERPESITPSAFATTGGTRPGPAPSDPATTAAGRGASFGSLLLAALLGGAVAGGGLYAAGHSGVLPFAATDGSAPEMAALQNELGAVRSDVAALKAAGPAAPAGETNIEPLREQIGALEASIAELRNQPAAGGDAGPAAEQVRSRLDAVEKSLAEARQAGAGPELAQIETQLSSLAGEVEQLRSSASTTGEIQPVLNDVARRIEDVAGRVGTLEERPVPDTAPLQSAVDELRTAIGDLQQRLDSAATKEDVAALQPELQRANERADQALRLAPALAADALASAVERGRPFQAELASLRSLGIDDPALAELEPQAEAGLPSVAALAGEFDRLSEQIETRTPIPPSTGALDRILQSARGLVEVRPAGQVEGSEPAAVLARVKDALHRGDLQAAVGEWEALPADAKTATQSWAEKAKARLAAEALAAKLRSDALSRIGTQS